MKSFVTFPTYQPGAKNTDDKLERLKSLSTSIGQLILGVFENIEKQFATQPDLDANSNLIPLLRDLASTDGFLRTPLDFALL